MSNASNAGRRIRFGGPALPRGTRTWFYDMTQELETAPNAPADYAIVPALYGEEYDAAVVADAETYVERGMAEFVVPAARVTPAGQGKTTDKAAE